MFAFVLSICWGLLNDKLLTLASVYAWGIGDAFAALIGKRFGKQKFKLKFVDPKKSIEGSLSMWIASFISVLIILLVRRGLPFYSYFVIAIVVSFVSCVAELYTNGGMDTITCPIASMIVMLPLIYLFGGLMI